MTKLNETAANMQLADTAIRRFATPISDTRRTKMPTIKCTCKMRGWHKMSCPANSVFTRG